MPRWSVEVYLSLPELLDRLEIAGDNLVLEIGDIVLHKNFCIFTPNIFFCF